MSLLKVLLSFPFLVHRIEDGLAFGVVTPPQVVNLTLHILIQSPHFRLELIVRQISQLKNNNSSKYTFSINDQKKMFRQWSLIVT